MDIAAKISSDISNLINTNLYLIEGFSTESINVKDFEARENLINQLSKLSSVLPELCKKVDAVLTKTKDIHGRELSAMDSLLNKVKKKDPEESSWRTVVRKRNKFDNDRSQKTQSVSTLQPLHNISSTQKAQLIPNVNENEMKDQPENVTQVTKSRIKFTEALSLPAIKVPTFDYVKSDGELYYVECADHFAFKLAGQLMHGNIGVIYTEEKNPEKIKDCKFAANCMKQDKCDYYHDPVEFPGSKDHRNFIASSWLYAPPNSQFKNRSRSRRFGSRDHLDTDIVGLQSEEITRFNDQTVHDVLCALLLHDAYKEK